MAGMSAGERGERDGWIVSAACPAQAQAQAQAQSQAQALERCAVIAMRAPLGVLRRPL